MTNRITKAFKSIFLEGNFHRIWQILLKSPLVHFLAWLHNLWSPSIRRSRVQLAKNLQLSEVQKKILNDLNQNGFASADSLFDISDLSPLESYLSKKAKQVEKAKLEQLSNHKDFWVRLSDSDFIQGMTTEHPLVKLSLKKEVLEVIAGYFKRAGFLEYLLLTYSVPSHQPLKASQLWHQDHDNNRMLKLFFYLSDVESEADGPFTLLPKKANSLIKNSFFPRHLPDAEVNSQFPLTQAVKIHGRQFSAFLVDTSVCYHMGSRVAEGHSRLMSTSLYVTLPKAYWGPVKDFIHSKTSLSPLQEAAIKSSYSASDTGR